jgi:hypothetical protein
MDKDCNSKSQDAYNDSSFRVISEKIKPEVFQEFYDLMESCEMGTVKCSDKISNLLDLAKLGTIESFRK